MAQLRLPPSVRDLRGQAIEAIVNRQAQIDLSPLLVYRIDSTPASAIPWLGWQFDLLSPLWRLIAPAGSADPDAARRALIKLGIALHRERGTPLAIKTALAALGWTATILEGQASWGGSSWPSNQGWAVCRILVGPPDLDINSIQAWDSTGATEYNAGSIVTFNGPTYAYAARVTRYFRAFAPVPSGLPPQFATVEDVSDFDILTNVDLLVPYPWYLVPPPPRQSASVPYTVADAARIAEVFEFFKPARCWLDSVWFVTPPYFDFAPSPVRDVLVVDGIGEFGSDSVPAPREGPLSIAIALAGFAENYPPIAPLQNKHFRQKGHNQGANQPIVADGPLVINGVIHGESN